MKYSPVILFTYNRPSHTIQTIEALLRNDEAAESDLIIYSDGTRDRASKEKVEKVRLYLKTISGFKTVQIIQREENLGLAQSIISGVSEVVNEYGRCIVLEDDLVTSPYFLKYMNDALNAYEHDDRVISIHGYCYPVGNLPETFFLKGADCWGWATWKRGWALFQEDGKKLLSELEHANLLSRFDFFGAYDYSGMLRDQIEGRNQSWAVRWYASALLKNKFTLYPGKTMVKNIGIDGSGTHCGDDEESRLYETDICQNSIRVSKIPVLENEEALTAFSQFFKPQRPLWRRVIKKLLQIW